MKFRVLLLTPLLVMLAASPFSCNTAKDAGVFKTADMGETWQQKVTIDDKNNIGKANILTMEMDPQNREVIYLGTSGNGLYKSENGGQNWIKIEDSRGFLSSKASINDIAIDPADTSKIYLATFQDKRGRVFRSQDGANSFEEVYVTDKEQFAINSIAVASHDPKTVYMASDQGGLIKSTDYGKSWRLVKWFDSSVFNLVINPKDNNIMYLNTKRQGVYKTHDSGASWLPLKDKLKEFRLASDVKTILIDYNNPSVVYLGSDFGLLRTQDAGDSWQAIEIVIPPKSTPILSVAIDPANSDHIYYGAGSIFYKSLDRGQNWTLHEIPSAKAIKAMVADYGDSSVIYLGMSEK